MTPSLSLRFWRLTIFPPRIISPVPPGENIEIVGTGVLLRVIKNAVDFAQAEDGLVAIHAVEHKHAEVARLDVHRPPPNDWNFRCRLL